MQKHSSFGFKVSLYVVIPGLPTCLAGYQLPPRHHRPLRFVFLRIGVFMVSCQTGVCETEIVDQKYQDMPCLIDPPTHKSLFQVLKNTQQQESYPSSAPYIHSFWEICKNVYQHLRNIMFYIFFTQVFSYSWKEHLHNLQLCSRPDGSSLVLDSLLRTKSSWNQIGISKRSYQVEN